MTEETKKGENKMQYNMLGNTGLKVSCLGLGFWATFAAKEDLDTTLSIMEFVRNRGVNFFDNAEEIVMEKRKPQWGKR